MEWKISYEREISVNCRTNLGLCLKSRTGDLVSKGKMGRRDPIPHAGTSDVMFRLKWLNDSIYGGWVIKRGSCRVKYVSVCIKLCALGAIISGNWQCWPGGIGRDVPACTGRMPSCSAFSLACVLVRGSFINDNNRMSKGTKRRKPNELVAFPVDTLIEAISLSNWGPQRKMNSGFRYPSAGKWRGNWNKIIAKY